MKSALFVSVLVTSFLGSCIKKDTTKLNKSRALISYNVESLEGHNILARHFRKGLAAFLAGAVTEGDQTILLLNNNRDRENFESAVDAHFKQLNGSESNSKNRNLVQEFGNRALNGAVSALNKKRTKLFSDLFILLDPQLRDGALEKDSLGVEARYALVDSSDKPKEIDYTLGAGEWNSKGSRLNENIEVKEKSNLEEEIRSHKKVRSAILKALPLISLKKPNAAKSMKKYLNPKILKPDSELTNQEKKELDRVLSNEEVKQMLTEIGLWGSTKSISFRFSF